MITSGKEVCPYFGKVERTRWHQERGIEDPQKAIIQREIKITSKPDGMTKQERYRAANREKLAEKARERRKAGGEVQGRETKLEK